MSVENEVTGGNDVGLVDLLAAVQRQLRAGLGTALARFDLSIDQWRALRAPGRSGGLTMGALSDLLSTPPPSTTRVVDGLVDRALVFRQPGKVDRLRSRRCSRTLTKRLPN